MDESKRFADRIEEAIQEAEAQYIAGVDRGSPNRGALPPANKNKPDSAKSPKGEPADEEDAGHGNE